MQPSHASTSPVAVEQPGAKSEDAPEAPPVPASVAKPPVKQRAKKGKAVHASSDEEGGAEEESHYIPGPRVAGKRKRAIELAGAAEA